MKFKDMIEKIHENAVNHGWWDGPKPESEVIALIHSEWSEAVEEARQGRPLRYKTKLYGLNTRAITPQDPDYGDSFGKPEGAAVEFADGAIRIMDWLGHIGYETDAEFDTLWKLPEKVPEWNLPNIVPEDVAGAAAYIHQLTSFSLRHPTGEASIDPIALIGALQAALTWIYQRGMDPEEIIEEKNRYNETRPYKHGKKF